MLPYQHFVHKANHDWPPSDSLLHACKPTFKGIFECVRLEPDARQTDLTNGFILAETDLQSHRCRGRKLVQEAEIAPLIDV